MATTPNFNWSTPDNTGLVKNGALDIRTLGNAIDASLVDLKGGTTGQVLAKASNTDMDFVWAADATGSPGLNLINTTSFSAVSNQAITGIFSSTYQNYVVYVQATLSASTALLFQMRSGGTTANTNYRVQRFMSSSTSNQSDRDADTSNFNTMYNAVTTCNGTVTLFRPFEAVQTGAIFEWTGQETTNSYILKGSGFHTTATSYDGLTVYPGSGTMTGVIRVYGVKN